MYVCYFLMMVSIPSTSGLPLHPYEFMMTLISFSADYLGKTISSQFGYELYRSVINKGFD